jgi:endonuclease/exonuclease/phosphatase (EEP) superfamily protein YafD
MRTISRLRSTLLAEVLLVPLLVAAGGCPSVRTPENPTGPSFTVMTWNVNWGGPEPEAVAQTLIEIGPDVVCLQETTPAWEAFLAPRLRSIYPHQVFCHSSKFPAAGFAVLSKNPILKREGAPEAGGVFGAGLFVVQTPVGPVQFWNTHLHPPFNLETGDLDLFTTATIRRDEVARLWDLTDHSAPAIFLGDMNEGDNGDAVRWLEKKGLVDALWEFDRTTYTWQWPLGWLTLRERLDHVLYPPPLYCLKAYVMDRGASDHRPVVASFEKRPTAPDEVRRPTSPAIAPGS